jgi:hypothetical protein
MIFHRILEYLENPTIYTIAKTLQCYLMFLYIHYCVIYYTVFEIYSENFKKSFLM